MRAPDFPGALHMISRRFFAVAVALLVSGCISAPPHSLSIADLQKYRISDVAVEGVEVIRSWPVQEETFVKATGADQETINRLQSEPASTFPGLRAHMQRVLSERFKLEFSSQVTPIFTGPRPVKAVVRLETFDVPSGARRVLIDQDAKIKANIDLVDASTGAVILSYAGPFRSRRLIGGLATAIAVALDRSDVGYSLITDYMTAYRDWLLQR
jgi:hypothetical protein